MLVISGVMTAPAQALGTWLEIEVNCPTIVYAGGAGGLDNANYKMIEAIGSLTYYVTLLSGNQVLEQDSFPTIFGPKNGGTPISGSLTVPDAYLGSPLTVTLTDSYGQTYVTYNFSCGQTVSSPGCPVGFPILSTALITTGQQQPAFDSPGGNEINTKSGQPIILPLDADHGGIDEYLVIDNAEGPDGKQWLGLWIGGCNPVYVPASKVTLTRPISQ